MPASDFSYMTVAQVAERLQVSANTVRRWIADGELAAAYLDSRRGGYRVAPDELERFVAARLTSAGTPGHPWRRAITFVSHDGVPERFGPSAAKHIAHEQELYGMILARQLLAHQQNEIINAPVGPPDPTWLTLPEPSSPAIEAITFYVNKEICFSCGHRPLRVGRNPNGVLASLLCERCGRDDYRAQYFGRCCHGCGGGNPMAFGTPFELHPRSLVRGRIRAAFGMAFCESCDHGQLYRWNAHPGGALITLIAWPERTRRLSLTIPIRLFWTK